MARIWTVKLKRNVSPSLGLLKGLTVQVMTQQNSHDYPTLRQALINAGYDVKNQGGFYNDDYWDWS